MPPSKRSAAAIDMGTNTFHILIAEENNGKLTEIVRKRVWVNLAEGGIDHICEAALDRAWKALKEFRSILDNHDGIQVTAVATEAFRSADNGLPFLHRINKSLGIYPDIIPGEKEAYLIYRGISLISPQSEFPSLIMDIGGGSTEFILFNNEGIIWSHSYKAGVTYLFNNYAQTDPLAPDDEQALVRYFKSIFFDLAAICSNHNVESVIGASGSFEVLELLAGMVPDYKNINWVTAIEFYRQYDLLRLTTGQVRMDDFRVPEARARMIVVALVLMKYIIDEVRPESIGISPYAMKEGIIAETLNI